MTTTIDEMAEMIKEKEKELFELKKEYRERRSEGLRHAIEQRKEAEKLVREEMKALGYDYGSTVRYWLQMSAYSATQIARKNGYRSGLEDKVAEYLKDNSVTFLYEKVKIEWEDLAYRTYTPDFVLDNGIIIETKGMFTTADRRKHVCVKKQHPDLDIRFVFENSNRKLYKNAKSTYAQWCIKHGFRYNTRIIPEDWLKEKGKNNHPKFIKFLGKKLRS